MKDQKRARVENWLIKYYSLINSQSFERELNFPRGTIQKSVKYGRKLSDYRIKALFNLLKKMTI